MLRVRDGANVRKGRTSTYRLGCVWQFARSTAQAEVRAEVQARLYLKGGWRSLGPQSALPTTLLPDRQSKINSGLVGRAEDWCGGPKRVKSRERPFRRGRAGWVLGVWCWEGGCLGGQHAGRRSLAHRCLSRDGLQPWAIAADQGQRMRMHASEQLPATSSGEGFGLFCWAGRRRWAACDFRRLEIN